MKTTPTTTTNSLTNLSVCMSVVLCVMRSHHMFFVCFILEDDTMFWDCCRCYSPATSTSCSSYGPFLATWRYHFLVFVLFVYYFCFFIFFFLMVMGYVSCHEKQEQDVEVPHSFHGRHTHSHTYTSNILHTCMQWHTYLQHHTTAQTAVFRLRERCKDAVEGSEEKKTKQFVLGVRAPWTVT